MYIVRKPHFSGNIKHYFPNSSCWFAVQARRRTTTQMELLYANSDSAPDAPTDFSGPMLPLAETPEGGGDADLSASSVRDYTALSPGFSSKMGSM